MLKFIPNWQDKGLKCHFCGTTKSVKYSVSMNGAVVCSCNKCVMLYTHNPKKEGVQGE